MTPFFIEEVREVLWSSDGNKCPGPDGFNFNFIKACWEIIKGDIMAFLTEFHISAHLPKAFTASFLALIPKKDHPQVLSDYRPICLVSSLYKILSKVLASRLKKVLGWRKWIRACVFQSSMSVLVNGSLTHDFIVGKGLRQGDPLSPFLFLIVAEGLTGLMNKAVDRSLFTVISINTVLRSFEIVSGLKVNVNKSKLYGVNLEDRFLRASSYFLHCGVDSIPFRFLGIPVASVCVVKELVSIQRKFLWGGRYGSFAANFLYGEGRVGLNKASIGWRDIWRLGGEKEGNWFGGNISTILGDVQPDGVISTMGLSVCDNWAWKLEWTAMLNVSDSENEQDLLLILEQVRPRRAVSDKRRWKPQAAGFFSVKTAYTTLQNRSSTIEIETIKYAWISSPKASSK
ncbi:cysteine-rich receptor-like protein kinase, partial [Trifolium pratense]